MESAIEKTRQQWDALNVIRDGGLTVPEGITRQLDISYGPHGKWNLLDIYRPEGAEGMLPTIISIHGGGWFHGDKETYSHYCMRLALQGFAVVNFNYRLAPADPYPAGLQDVVEVLRWVQTQGENYGLDIRNLFVVGDSAGGQLAYQVLTMLTSRDYWSLFDFGPKPELTIRACGLNCGCYFLPFNRLLKPKMMGPIFEAYLPGDYMAAVPQLKTGKYVNSAFPPAFVMSARNDYLLFMAKPLHNLLRRRGVETVVKIYGKKAQKDIGHVFHLNCRSDLAKQCNDDQCAFFRAHIQRP